MYFLFILLILSYVPSFAMNQRGGGGSFSISIAQPLNQKGGEVSVSPKEARSIGTIERLRRKTAAECGGKRSHDKRTLDNLEKERDKKIAKQAAARRSVPGF